MKNKKYFSKLPKKSTLKEEKEKHITRLVKLMINLAQDTLNLDEAAQNCNVSKRTILRDIKILEDAGIPLYKPNEKESNYCITEDFSLPHFQVTPKNALDFVDALDALVSVGQKPLKFVEPIQKGVVEVGHDLQKKRKEERDCLESTNEITEEQLASLWLCEEDIKTNPYMSLMVFLGIKDFFDDKERGRLYRNWQIKNIRRSLANMYYLGQKYKASLEECDALIKEDPKDLRAYKQAALACYASKNFKRGIDYILDGLDKNEIDLELIVCIIPLFIANKNYDKAIKFFNMIYKDEYPRNHFASTVYAKAGLFDKAFEVLDRAIKQDPKHANKYKEVKEGILKEQNAKK